MRLVLFELSFDIYSVRSLSYHDRHMYQMLPTRKYRKNHLVLFVWWVSIDVIYVCEFVSITTFLTQSAIDYELATTTYRTIDDILNILPHRSELRSVFCSVCFCFSWIFLPLDRFVVAFVFMKQRVSVFWQELLADKNIVKHFQFWPILYAFLVVFGVYHSYCCCFCCCLFPPVIRWLYDSMCTMHIHKDHVIRPNQAIFYWIQFVDEFFVIAFWFLSTWLAFKWQRWRKIALKSVVFFALSIYVVIVANLKLVYD